MRGKEVISVGDWIIADEESLWLIVHVNCPTAILNGDLGVADSSGCLDCGQEPPLQIKMAIWNHYDV